MLHISAARLRYEGSSLPVIRFFQWLSLWHMVIIMKRRLLLASPKFRVREHSQLQLYVIRQDWSQAHTNKK